MGGRQLIGDHLHSELMSDSFSVMALLMHLYNLWQSPQGIGFWCHFFSKLSILEISQPYGEETADYKALLQEAPASFFRMSCSKKKLHMIRENFGETQSDCYHGSHRIHAVNLSGQVDISSHSWQLLDYNIVYLVSEWTPVCPPRS